MNTKVNLPYSSIWMDLMGVAFSQGYVDAKGVRTRYLHSGTTDKPALFLLHGTGGHAEAYVRNLRSHGEHFSTWVPDMIGCGLTDKPAVDLEVKVYVQHLVDTMDALGIAKASISGESLGGWVAAQFALDHPDRVDRLVLNTAGGSWSNPEVMSRVKTLSMAAVEDPNWDRIRTRLEFLVHDKSDVCDDLVATRRAIYAQPGMVEAMRRALVLQEIDIRQRNLLSDADWARIAAPTLVLWTSHDPTAPVSMGRRVADLIAGSRFVVMQDCGHWPQYEDPETFDRVHLDFLLGR
jgi:2-hydroxy-6-oxonona-2,4-dienedioate hydrolase